jgi:hypothetical protein
MKLRGGDEGRRATLLARPGNREMCDSNSGILASWLPILLEGSISR